MHRLAVLTIFAVAGAPSLAAQGATIELRDNPDAKEFVISIGPIDLPAMSQQTGHDHEAGGEHHGVMFLPPVQEVAIPFDAYLYGFRYELVDADGNEVPSQLLHHLNVIDPEHRDLFLPISYRVAAVGSETGPLRMPWLLFGQPVEAGQRLVIAAMLHNPTGTAYRGVTVNFIFQYVKPGRPWPLFPVYSFQVDVAFPAGDKDFDLPPGRTTKSWEGSPSIDGRIVAIGGHLHDYAVNVTLEDVTDGKQIWQGEPILDDEGRLVGVTLGRLYRRLGVRIHTDHVYRVSVTYDNPTQDTILKGGMGLVAGLFIPGIDEWPAADVTDALYVLDRQHYLRMIRGSLDEIERSDSTAVGDRSRHSHRAM